MFQVFKSLPLNENFSPKIDKEISIKVHQYKHKDTNTNAKLVFLNTASSGKILLKKAVQWKSTPLHFVVIKLHRNPYKSASIQI